MSKLLVVDDEQSICWGLAKLGTSLGHEVQTASSAEQALRLVDDYQPEAVMLDVRLPGMDGLAAIEHLRAKIGPAPIIIMTAYGDLQTAVQAVRQGAFEYILKPFDLDKVQSVITRALASGQPARPDEPVAHVGGLVGSSSAMQEAFKRIALAAASDANVLISGESGTGKELAARAIHNFSARSEAPFVTVNVASLSPSLAESELFGHERGSFTGADVSRMGLLAQANGGTLFLDEVADIPLPTQVKLLRAIELGEVQPVGSNQTVPAQFRVVSATHQNLVARVQAGEFRHDLYYRLCSFEIGLPALRERNGDIELLAKYFAALLARRSNRAAPPMPPEFVAELRRRPWHGNVRELRNAIEHAMVVARDGALLPEHLAAPIAVTGEAAPADHAARIAADVRAWAAEQLSRDANELHTALLALVEPSLLSEALAQCDGQCLAAARRLGLHRTTVKKKLDEYGIDGD